MLKKIEAGARTPSSPLLTRLEMVLGPFSRPAAIRSVSGTVLFTVVAIEHDSDIASLLSRAGMQTRSDVQRIAAGESPTVDRRGPEAATFLNAQTPEVGVEIAGLILGQGARRVVVHAGTGELATVVRVASELLTQARPGITESETVQALTRHWPDSPLNDRLLRFGNTGRIAPMTSALIGRDALLEHLVQTIGERSSQLVTLTGPGGVGKTALALAAVLRVGSLPVDPSSRSPVLVDLSQARDTSEAIDAVSQAMDREVANEPGRDWIERMASWSGLLLLDSCEHVRDIAFTVSRIIQETSAMVLVTSRMSLGARREHEFAVPPLETGDFSDSEWSPAMALFVSRSARQPVSIAAKRAVHELCKRLDGLPLAIELAAARSNRTPVGAMADHIALRVDDLADTTTNGAVRHRTLRATIEWSLSLLRPESLIALRRLSVVEGSFDFDAIATIGLRWPESKANPEALLSELVADHLAVADSGEASAFEPGARSWHLYGTLREVLQSQLNAAEEGAVRSDHASWVFDVVHRVSPELYGGNQAQAQQRLLAILPDVRTAIGWSLTVGEYEAPARTISALQRFWSRAGRFTEARNWFSQIDLDQLTEHTRAKLLNTAGTLAFLQGDIEASFEPLGESAMLFAAAGDLRGQADALANLGVGHSQIQNLDVGVSFTERSLELRRAANDERGVAISLGNLGYFAGLRGEPRAGRTFLEESIEIHRRIDDGYLLAEALQDLAKLEAADGETTLPGQRLLEALAIAQQLSADRIIAAVLDCMVEVTSVEQLRTERCRMGAALYGAASAARRRAGVRAMSLESESVVRIASLLGPRVWTTLLEEGAELDAAGVAELADRFLRPARALPAGRRSASLSGRELRVLRLLGDGSTNKDIARELGIRPATVATHVRTLFSKLGVTSRAAAVAVAAEEGLR